MGRELGYHTIALIITVVGVLKGVILGEVGYSILSDLGDMYIKPIRGRDHSHFFKIFIPQVALPTAIPSTKLYLNLVRSYGILYVFDQRRFVPRPVTPIHELVFTCLPRNMCNKFH